MMYTKFCILDGDVAPDIIVNRNLPRAALKGITIDQKSLELLLLQGILFYRYRLYNVVGRHRNIYLINKDNYDKHLLGKHPGAKEHDKI